MTKDIKYIIKRIIIGVGIILVMTFINSCEVHAESFVATPNTTLAGYYFPGWWQFSTTSRTLLLKYEDWQYFNQGENAWFGYLTTCATAKFSVNNASADCNDGCFNNDFHVVPIGTSCVVHAGSNLSGSMYYVFYSIKQIGWKNADTLPVVYDNLTFKTSSGTATVEFLDNILTTDDLYINYVTSDRLDELITATQSQTNTIINNNNTNTNSIINNNNTNTQEIINNQNENSQTCSTSASLKWSSGKAYNDYGVLVSNSSSFYTNKIYAKGGSSLTINGTGGGRLIFFDKNGNFLDWYTVVDGRVITITSNVYYIGISSTLNNIKITFTNEVCSNKTDLLNDSVSNLNDNITDDNIDSADSKASEWASKSLSDNAVANMVTMPITLLQAYLNGLNGNCSSFSLGTLYNHELTLPCINLSTYFGSTLWGVIDILFSGFMIYAMGKKFVKIFNDFTNLRDNQVDELYGGGN